MPEKDWGKLRHGEDADPEKTQETTPSPGPWPHRFPCPLPSVCSCLGASRIRALGQGTSHPQEHPQSRASSPGLPGLSVQLFRKENIFFPLYLDSCRDSDGEKRRSDY